MIYFRLIFINGVNMKSDDKLQKLKEKRTQLDKRIQLMENRQKHKERKDDTRRKILVGSYYLDDAEKNGTINNIKKLMDSYLTRDADRTLFELSSKEK